MQKKKLIKISQSANILAPTYGTNSTESPVFSIKDRNGSSIIVATSNHATFEVFTRAGGELPVGGRCDNCKEDFPHTAVGYPVAYREMNILTNAEHDVNNAQYRIMYIFWTEGCHCSFECALTVVQSFVNRPSNYRDNAMDEHERTLKLLYKLTYPNSGPLRPAKDRRLYANSNQGSLTKNEWLDSKHIYIRSGRVLVIPAKVEYFRHNFETHQMPLNIDIVNNTYTTVTPSSH
jgi:hypothetical protein